MIYIYFRNVAKSFVSHSHKSASFRYVRHRERLADSDDDNGPEDDDAWLFEDLIILAKLYSQLRDKEQLIELIFEVGLLFYCPPK